MKRPMMLVVVAATLLLATVVVTGPGQAEVRGANGQIAFERVAPGQPFEAPGNGTVFVANPDGTHAQQVPLVYPTDLVTPLDWSSDGMKLLIAYTVRFDDSGNCCLPFRPAIVSPDGSGFALLEMPYAPFEMECPVWSLDQTRILCGFGGDQPGVFSVRASDGGDPIRLTTNPYHEGQDLPTDISPDGARFVFIRFKPGPTNQAKHSALFVENMDGTGLRQITPYGLTHAHDLPWADWSPDGKEIIAATTQGLLFTVQPDGTGLRTIHLQVGTGNYFAFQAHWSPDGTRIVFGMFINGGEGIYTANPDGSNVVEVTDAPTGFDTAPDWGTHPLA